MKKFLLFVVLLAGCEEQPPADLLGECFAVAAYEAIRARRSRGSEGAQEVLREVQERPRQVR